MKIKLSLIYMLAMVMVAINACKKSGTVTSVMSDQQLIEQAHTYFDDQLSSINYEPEKSVLPAKSRTPDWATSKVVTFPTLGKAVRVPLKSDKEYSLKNGSGTLCLLGEDLALYFFYTSQGVDARVIARLPDHQQPPSKQFTGIGIMERWDGTFIKAYQVTGGKAQRVDIRKSAQRADENARLDCYTTEWWQCGTYLDYTECHYLYSSYNCISMQDDQDGSEMINEGGGGGGGNGGGGGSGGGETSSNPENRINITSDNGRLSCQSFKFTKVAPGANSQEAGIKGLAFVIDWFPGIPAEVFKFRTLYVNVGVQQVNGNIITPGKAAVAAAKAANMAGAALQVQYFGSATAEQLPTLSTTVIEGEFMVLMKTFLAAELNGYSGIRVTPSSSTVIVKDAVWNSLTAQFINALTGYDCDN